MSNLPESENISVAVITGGHAFDVPNFHILFDNVPGADCYIQHIENFCADVGKVQEEYDVVLFYTMPRGIPSQEGRGPHRRIGPALEKLGKTKQGIFILHHGVLTYGEWDVFSKLVGIKNREIDSFDHDINLRIEITNSNHPITTDLEPWDMIDETYVMQEPEASCEILLETNHPKSMNAIAWTHDVDEARVFCFQSGHDNQTYVNPGFRTVLERGIQWCAGRI